MKTKSPLFRFDRLLIAALALLAVPQVNAQTTNTWTGSSGGAWTTAGNWSTAAVPTSTTVVRVTNTNTTYSVGINGGTTSTNNAAGFRYAQNGTLTFLSSSAALNANNSNSILRVFGWVEGGQTNLIINDSTSGHIIFTNNASPTATTGLLRFTLSSGGVINVSNVGAQVSLMSLVQDFAGTTNTITKTGAGTLIIGGTNVNTWAGGLVLNAGVLQLNKSSALGAESGLGLTINGGSLDNGSGAAVTLSNYAQTWGGNFSFIGTTNLNLGAGAVNLTGTRTVTVTANALTVGGTITNTGGITKAGAGTLVLNGANTYSGTTTVNAGTLSLGNTNALQNSLLDTGTSGSQVVTFDVAGNNTYNVGGLQGGDALAIGANTLSVGAGGGSTTYSGAISGTGGALTKVGAGTLTLSTNSSYTGATTVSAGLLAYNGTNTSTAVTINSGGALGGSGSVGAVTVNNGARIAPGNAGVGTLSVSSLTLEGGGGYNWELSNVTGTAGTNWDLINVGSTSGTVTVNATSGSQFTIFINGTWGGSGFSGNSSYSWTLIDAGTLTRFATDKFAVNTAGFTGGTATGTWGFSDSSGNLLLSYTAPVLSSDFVWNTTSGAWSAGANWSGSSAPTNGSSLTFAGSGGASTNDNTLNNVVGITFSNTAGTYNLSGNAFTNGSAGIVNNSSSAQTISNDMTLGAAQSFNAASGDLTFAGAISNNANLLTVSGSSNTVLSGVVSGTAGLTKSGTGSLTLGANNSFTGALAANGGTTLLNGTQDTTTVNVGGGILLLGGNNRLADGATLALSSGTVNFGGFSDTVTTFNISGGVFTNGIATATTYGLSGGTVGGTLSGGTANVTGGVSLSGVIDSTLNINIGGTLTLAAADRIANTSAVTVNAGTLATATFNDTVGSLVLTNNGSITGSGTITASTYALQGGTLNAGLGAGDITVTTGTTTLGSAGRLNSASTLTINSGQLSLGGTETVASLGGAGGTLNLGANGLTFGGNNADTTFSGVISGAGGSLTKTGAGTATLAGTSANTFTGTTTVSAGTLRLNKTSVDALATNVTVNTGGTLLLGAANQIAAATVTLGGGTFNIAGFSDTIGTLQLNSGTLAGSGGTLTATTYNLAGGIVGGNLGTGTINASANATLNGTAAATAINITGGTLTLGSASRLTGTTPTVVITNGAALALGGNESIGTLNLTNGTVSGSGTLSVSSAINAQSGSISANLAGAAGLTKTTASTVILSGANTFSGAVAVNGGTLALSNGSALSDSAAVTLANTAGVILEVDSNETIGSLAGGGTTGGTVALDINTLTLNQSGNTSYTGAITGTGTLAKSGVGTLTFNQTSAIGADFSLRINSGVVNLDRAGADLLGILGSGNLVEFSGGELRLTSNSGGETRVNAAGFSVLQNSTLMINRTGGSAGHTTTITTPWSFTNGAQITLDYAGVSAADKATTTYSGANTLNSDGIIVVQNSGGGTAEVIFSSAFGDGGSGYGLTKLGAQTMTLSAANTYSGNTVVGGGTLQLSGSGRIADTSLVVVSNSATMNFNSLSDTVKGVSGAGTVSLGSATLTASNAATDTFSGVISGATANFVKLGAGTQVLSGGTSSYSGTTTVGNGVLRVATLANSNNNSSIGSGTTIVLTNGGVLDYTGGDVSINRGISLASGTGGIGVSNAATTLTVSTVISNSGSLIKTGLGTLTLSGANTYNGGTLVSAGALSGSTTSLRGAITNNGTVIFSQSTNGTYAGVLSGAGGGLTKSGTGTVTMTAANTFSGPTTITAGRLLVNGTNANSAVTINTNASLGGSGQVGDLTVSGLLAPGNSVGSLSAGNTIFNTNGSFQLEIFDFTGTAGTGWDLLTVNGDLTLSNTALSPFTINLVSMSATNTAGSATNFNADQSFTNTFLTYSGSLLGNTFATNLFTLNTNSFANALNGAFSIANVGQSLALVYSTFYVPPSSFTWSAGSGLWSDTNNWTEASAPTAGAGIVFAGAAGGNSTNNQVNSVIGLNFSNTAGSFTVSGNAMTNGADGVVNNSANAQTINNDLALGAVQTFNAASGDLTFGGAITNNGNLLTVSGAANTAINGIVSGNGGLTKSGAGSLTLGGNNTFTGTLAANVGTVVVNGTQATAAVNVAGGTLLLGTNNVLSDSTALTFSTGTVNFGGFSDTVSTFNQSGGVFTNGTLTATTYGLSGGTVGGALGAGTANVTGAVSLSGTIGATTLNVNTNGTLTLAASDRIGGSTAVVVNAGTLAMTNFNDTVGSLVLTNSGSLTGAGTITAASYTLNGGTVTANLGAGTATSSAATTTLNGTLGGDLAVSGGTVNLGSGDRIGGTSAVTISSGTLGISTFNDTVGGFTITGGTLGGTTGTLTAGTYALQGGTLSANLGAGTATVTTGTTTLNGTLGAATVNINSGTLNLGSANRLSDSAAVTLNGGTLGISTLTDTVGSFTIAGGTLGGSSGTLTASTYALNGGTLTANLGTGSATASSGTTSLNGTLAATTLSINGGTVNLGSANRLADTAAITLSSGTLGMSTFSDTVGSFVLSGGTFGGTTGTLTAATYDLQSGTINARLGAGAVTVSNGTTALGSTGRLNSASTLAVNGGQLTLGGAETVSTYTQTGGTLGGVGQTLTAGSYALQGGTVTANLGTGTTTASTGTTTINGNLGGALTASGGTANLNGTVAGNVTVSGGTVNLGSVDRIGATSAVAVSSGALNLNGNDSVGAVTLTGGTIGGIGALTATNYDVQAGTISAALGGSAAFTKSGAGTATLSGDNSSYSGAINLQAGAIIAANNNALGTSAVTLTNGNLFAANGVTNANTITIGTAGGGGFVTNAYVSTNIAGWDFSGLTAYGSSPLAPTTNASAGVSIVGLTRGSGVGTDGTAAGNAWGGSDWSTSTNPATAISSGDFATFAVSISNGFALNLTNFAAYNVRRSSTGPTTGQWQWSTNGVDFVDIGTAITWGNVTSGSAGNPQLAISFTNINQLQALGGGSTVTFRVVNYGASGAGTWYLNDPSGTSALDFLLNGQIATVTGGGAATGSGTLGISEAGTATFSGNIVNNTEATFTAASGGTATFSGAISGAGTLSKTGIGTVTLSGGSANTFTGTTTVSAGTLQLNKTADVTALSSTNLIVSKVDNDNRAVLLLSANNQVANTTKVTLSGGTIRRGGDVSEIFGSLNLTEGSLLDYGADNAIGTLTFTGTYTPSALLTVQNFLPGSKLQFGSSISSADLNNTSLFSFSNGFTTGNEGGYFTITAIPEPSTYLAAAGLLGLMLWPSRKRLLKDAKKILGMTPPMRDRLARRASELRAES